METSPRLFALTFTLAALTLSANLYAARPEGTLSVTVVDENGAVVQDAPVNIYGEYKTHFVGGKDIPGTVTLSMPAGDYRISSAVTKKNGEYLDSYASHEAHVQVTAGDNASVILTLKAIGDPASALTYAELYRFGLNAKDF